jgi:hypothetical protein
VPSQVPQPRSRRWRALAALAAVVALVAVSPLLFGLRDGGSGSDGVGDAANDGCGTGASGTVLKVRTGVLRADLSAVAWIAPRTGDFRIEQGDAPIVRCGGGTNPPLLVRAVRAWKDGERRVETPAPAFTVEPMSDSGPATLLVTQGGGGQFLFTVEDEISADEARRRGLFAGGDQG